MTPFFSSLLLGISLAAPVGPISVEIIRRAMKHGFFNGLVVGLGGITADICFMLLIFWGLHPLLQHEYAQFFMYSFGAVILIYLAINSLDTTSISKMNKHSNEPAHSKQLKKSYQVGFFIALFNPINIVFWFAIYGSVLSEQLQQPFTLIALHSSAIFFGILLWNLNIAFLAHFLRTLMNPFVFRFIHIGAAILLTAFSIHFLIKALTILLT
ncbi:LysE family translocator [Alkalihalobacillus pseudalcaliphilus]|uniref:LysE family translocator n=1 Tax=Alkalihalobacillus pseudalcaliphilus TaxID=79884 RepID=UPI00064DB7DB|nr:LysE family transporter [Alkalihalobacillus pseudalcaliphilus]KMK76030.1 hypothetical protein AB990_12410 [Alkalihalobacillus pseudalcaliphilus]